MIEPIATAYTAITYAAEAGIATVSLNRPGARNGYTMARADELAHAFGTAEYDPTVRVVVFTSLGRDFFRGC